MHDKPSTTILFPEESVDFNDFLVLLGTRCNALPLGINAILYKVYKKSPQLSRFLFGILKSCLKHGVDLSNSMAICSGALHP